MITLKELVLDGWMSYDKATISFSDLGVVQLAGNTGAGKSSILEAVVYLLFGTTIRKKTSVNDLANRILNSGYSIRIDIDVGGIPASIQEIRGRGKDSLNFVVDGVDRRGKTANETRKKILEFIGMSPDEFLSIAMLGQRQSQVLIEGTNSERSNAIVNLFSLNRYDEYIDKCDTSIKDMQTQYKNLQYKLLVVQKDLDMYASDLSNDGTIIPIDESEISRLDGEISIVKDKLNKIQIKLGNFKEQLGHISACESQAKKLEQGKKEIELLEKSINMVMDVATFNEDDLSKMQHQLYQLKAKNDALKSTIKEIQSVGNLCPITKKDCPVNVPTEYKESRLSDCQEQMMNNDMIVKDVKVKLDSLQSMKTVIDQRKQLAFKKDALSKIVVQQVSGKDEVLQNIDQCSDAINRGSSKLNQLVKEKQDILLNNTKYKERMLFMEKAKKITIQKEQEKQELQSKISELSLEMQYTTTALGILRKARMFRIDSVLELLNQNLDATLHTISDGQLKAQFSSQKMAASGKKILDKIDILVSDPYKTVPIELVSGGQSSQVGLGILLSVWKTSKQISNKSVSCLFLDEVFGSLNPELASNCFSAVVDVCKSAGASSVFVISHQELPQNMFDKHIMVNNNNGISSLEGL